MEVTGVTEPRIGLQDSVNTEVTDVEGSGETNGGTDSVASEFEEFMRTALGGAAKAEVNEEELFAALIGQRLTEENPEAAQYYESQKSTLMSSLRRADGYVSVEQAAVEALRATVDAGKIDLETAERINGEAFAGAQLDDNKEALFDSFGSEGDPTVAVSNMEAALLALRTFNDQLEAGELTAAPRPLDAPTTTGAGSGSTDGAGAGGPAPSGEQSVDGEGGFLWKPESENDGNLVVLLPTSFNGLIDRVEIHSTLPPTPETLLGSGRFAGDEHNGNRSHWRFDQPGEDFGENVHVVVYKDDGSTATWAIGNGGERHD